LLGAIVYRFSPALPLGKSVQFAWGTLGSVYFMARIGSFWLVYAGTAMGVLSIAILVASANPNLWKGARAGMSSLDAENEGGHRNRSLNGGFR
jgi:hypothetical protein